MYMVFVPARLLKPPRLLCTSNNVTVPVIKQVISTHTSKKKLRMVLLAGNNGIDPSSIR